MGWALGDSAASYHERPAERDHRIVQYKMILKRGLIPTQDDPENVRGRGGLRPDANTHAERRGAHSGTDSRVPQRQSVDRVQLQESGRAVPVCAASAGGSTVRSTGQKATRSGARVPKQSDGTALAANDALDPQIPRGGRGGSGGLSAAAISEQIHAPGRDAVGGGGWRARLAERAGHGGDSPAGIPAVRPSRLRAPGGNFSSACVQLAAQRALSEASGQMGAHAARGGAGRRR